MTKSLEVTIALMLLFFFIFSAIQLNRLDNRLKINQSSKDIIYLKSQESDFRTLVSEKKVDEIYDSLYAYLDMIYAVGVCDHIQENCIYNEIGHLSYKNTKNYSYYFFIPNFVILCNFIHFFFRFF